jgi:hypothetical protein
MTVDFIFLFDTFISQLLSKYIYFCIGTIAFFLFSVNIIIRRHNLCARKCVISDSYHIIYNLYMLYNSKLLGLYEKLLNVNLNKCMGAIKGGCTSTHPSVIDWIDAFPQTEINALISVFFQSLVPFFLSKKKNSPSNCNCF